MIRTLSPLRLLLHAALFVAFIASSQAAPVRFQFTSLGYSGSSYFHFVPDGLSPSGCAIAGQTSLESQDIVQAAWKHGIGFVPVELPADYPRYRRTTLRAAITDNGILAGNYLWRFNAQDTTYRLVQELPSVFSSSASTGQVIGASSDGSILGGFSITYDFDEWGDYLATAWRPLTPGDPESLYGASVLNPLPGHTQSAVQDVSRDGSVMVGYSQSGDAPVQLLIRWRPQVSAEPQLLPTPTFPPIGHNTAHVSPNGNEIAVARCFFYGGEHETCSAHIVSADETVTPLDLRHPEAISDNRVVVGRGGDNNDLALWAPYLGATRQLSAVLKHAGLSDQAAANWLSVASFDISADGRTLLGRGIDLNTFDIGLLLIELPLPGDANGDSHVDLADFALLKSTFGQSGPALVADHNFDAAVDGKDFLIWQRSFGQTAGSGVGFCANAAVPEPATLVMLMFAPAGFRAGRGRAVQVKCQKHMRAFSFAPPLNGP